MVMTMAQRTEGPSSCHDTTPPDLEPFFSKV